MASTNTKISILSVSMGWKDSTQLTCMLTKILQQAFDKIEVQTCIDIENLKEEIICFTNLNMTDIILMFGACSLKNNIISIIDEVRDTETIIAKLFAKVPILLKPVNSEFVYCAYRKNTLIFCVTGDDTDIISTVQGSAVSMVFAVYLLRNVLTNFNVSNQLHKREEQMLCCSEQSSYIKEKTLSISQDLTCIENLQINEADIRAFTSEMCLHISADNAMTIIIDTVCANDTIALKIEEVDIYNALGRRLHEAATSRNNVPPFSIATKNGYAIISGAEAKKIGRTSDESKEIIFDTISIYKGERIPLGTTAIIPADNVTSSYDNKGNKIMTTSKLIENGQNIKYSGSDIKKGQIIVPSHRSMSSIEIGLLTACGWKKVKVVEVKPTGILTVGDKLQEPGEYLKPGHSYDNSRVILNSLLKENNFDCFNFGIIIKNLKLMIQTITTALKTVDILVTTSCSSDKDYLKYILMRHFKTTFHFENVNIKPGKSTAFATCIFDDKIKYILCLPRNPTSVLVTAHLFLLPLINWIHYDTDLKPTKVMAKVEQKLLLHSRPRYVWATLSWSEEKNYAEAYCKGDNSMNNNLSDIINANTLLILPAKSSNADMLETPAFVSALIVKFPSSI